MKDETSSPLNALALATAKLAEARAAAEAHVAQIHNARTEMERTGFQFAPGDSVAQVAAAGAEWERKRTALRGAAMNFDQAVFVRDALDDLPETKTMLEAALEFLETRHKAFVKASKPSLLSKVTDAFKPSQSAQDDAPKRPPVRGPFGYEEPPTVEIELAAISKHVALFPEGKSYAGIVSLMNALNGRLALPADKPKTAVRKDKGLVVVERRPGSPQPRTPYSHPSPIAQSNQSEPSPMRAQRIIVGA